jgi:diacylglycerol kinase family enzyme
MEGTAARSSDEWVDIPEDRYTLLMLHNLVDASRDFAMAPAAHVSDGAIDVVYAGTSDPKKTVSRSEFISLMLRIESGEHVDHPAVKYVKAAAVEVLPQDGYVMCDGEVLPFHGVLVRVIRGGMRVVRSL